MACDRIQEAIKYIVKLVETFPKSQVVYTKYIASKDPEGVWAEYNRMNADVNADHWLNEYVDELKSYLNRDNTYVKPNIHVARTRNSGNGSDAVNEYSLLVWSQNAVCCLQYMI